MKFTRIIAALTAVLALALVAGGVAQAKPHHHRHHKAIHCAKGKHRNGRRCVTNKHPVAVQPIPGPAGPAGPAGAPGATGTPGVSITGPEGAAGPEGPEAGSNADPSWGELTRNEFGSPTARTGFTSPPSSDGDGALILATADGTEKAEYGTESTFAGLKIASIDSLTYEEFVTDGDVGVNPENAINVQMEVNPHVAGKTYSSLVYDHGPVSVVNAWETVNAAGPVSGNGGWYFSNGTVAATTGCGQNAGEHFCTLAEVKAAAPDAEVSLSVGLGKGRDYQFQGAADRLAINGTVYDFTANGVVVE